MSGLLLYVSDSLDPYKNIATECAFMEQPFDGVVLYLWSNERTVVIGKHQNAARECDVKALLSDGGHLARRYSGGGAVYHDAENLNFTFAAPESLFDRGRHFSVIIGALSFFGLKAVVSGRNDMEIDGKKFSGNAFYDRNKTKLHHGTILINTDTDLMQKYLTVNSDKLVSHGVESVRARVVNLKELNPKIEKNILIEKLRESAEKTYDTEAAVLSAADLPRSYIAEKAEFLQSGDWLFGFETYANTAERKFSWGGAEVNYKVEKGVLTGLNIFTDALDADAIDEVKNSLLGKKVGDLKRGQSGVYEDIINLLI